MPLFHSRRGKRMMQPVGKQFELQDPSHLEQLKRLLEISHTPQVSIHFEVLGEDAQTTTLHYQMTQVPPEGSASQSSSVSRTSPNLQTTPNLQDPSASQVSGPSIDTIYAIASYSKILVNIAYALLIRHKEYKRFGLAWDTSACDKFNEIREQKGKSTMRRLYGNPEIRQLLIHENGIAPMNRYLFAPDGEFIMSQDEFIIAAPLITEDFYKDKYPHRGWVDYSNGNHIFAGMILEEVTGLELHKLMDELMFKPLNMTHSFMNERSLASYTATADIAIGHRGSADRSQTPGSSHRYLADVVEAAALGARSSTADLAKLFRALLKGAGDDPESLFNKDDILDIFHPSCSLRDGATTLAGLFSALNSVLSREESLNNVLIPQNEFSPYDVSRRRDGSQYKTYHKAGSVDGFTCSTYLLLKDRTFLIVLANSSGPFDITDYIARYVLQEAVPLSPRVDIVGRANKEGQMY